MLLRVTVHIQWRCVCAHVHQCVYMSKKKRQWKEERDKENFEKRMIGLLKPFSNQAFIGDLV